MSLPSRASFYKDGVKVGEMFINCGWTCTNDSVIRAMAWGLYHDPDKNVEDEDWTHCTAYGMTFTRGEINEVING